MSFKAGDKVVCIKKDAWIVTFKGNDKSYKNPLLNNTYTISHIKNNSRGTYLQFKELSLFGAWASFNFRKLDYDFVEEVIEMINEDNLVKVNN